MSFFSSSDRIGDKRFLASGFQPSFGLNMFPSSPSIKTEPLDDNDDALMDASDDYSIPAAQSPPRSKKFNSFKSASPTIKSEPFENDEPTYAQKPGYLTMRSACVRQYKYARAAGARPSTSPGTFETTGTIVGDQVCLNVTHMLIDTGATASSISGIAARRARLAIKKCAPESFETANGSLVTHDTYVEMQLYIAGVGQTISALVDETSSSNHVLIGADGIKAFDMKNNPNFGPRKESRWSMAQAKHVQSRERLVLRRDERSVPPSITVVAYSEGIRLARKRGETTTQRNQREVRERTKKRMSRIMANNGGTQASDGGWW